MSLFCFSSEYREMYLKLVELKAGVVGRVVSILGSGVTKRGQPWLHFKIALRKYGETTGENCKPDYYIVKAWNDAVEFCKAHLKPGCKITFGGEFIKSSVELEDGTRDCGEIKLLKIISVEGGK